MKNNFKDRDKQIEVNRLIQNIHFLRQLLLDSTFSNHIDNEDLPVSSLTTDEQLSEYIHQNVWGHHVCCTNKMENTKTDPFAVVDSKAQVKGIKNLRICDISIFPKIPGCFSVTSVLTACEKIVHDIIKTARY